jgi:drug/metabolite transporter (DMT)-like permease
VISTTMKELYAWAAIATIILSSTAGDVLLSYSMKRVGDVGELWRERGVLAVLGRVLSTPTFVFGVAAMAIAFYSLLFGLSWGNLSLVVPASTSLTFVTNAIAAKFFLHEQVSSRRWIAALLVGAGVILMAL